MILSEEAERFVEAQAPEHTAIQAEMAAHADEVGFPIIGRAAGGALSMLAATRSAERVFEFGSGYGYSATWFLRGMAPDGEIVLTELDAEDIALGQEFFDRASLADWVHYEHGDGIDVIDRYDGPFDIVLIDHEKRAYPDAFEAVAPKVPLGGIVVADNVMAGPVSYDELLAAIDGETTFEPGTRGDGLLTYLRMVESAPAWHTVVLPVGHGLAVSAKGHA